MLESNELKALAKSAKAVNAKLYRAAKHDILGKGVIQEAIDSLLADFETPGKGRIKAGKTFIKELAEADSNGLQQYIDTINTISSVISSLYTVQADMGDILANPENLWKLREWLKEKGTQLPSEELKEMIDADLDESELADIAVTIVGMGTSKSDISMSDFYKRYEELIGF